MKFPLIFVLFFFVAHSIEAATDKYRIIFTVDPATSITIAWNQISGSGQKVFFDIVDHGIDTTSYTNSQTPDRVQDYRDMNSQFARISGLTANTSYYFVIADSEGISERFWFKTTPNDMSRLSFIAGGDSRNNRTVRQDANTLVSKLKPHAVMFGGDMIDTDNRYRMARMV